MVREGYRDTEAGVLPEDWELIDFEDCFEFLLNNTLSRAELNYDFGEFRNIHYGDILMSLPSILDCSVVELPFINAGHTIKNNRSFLKNGDIIIADTAEDETVGKATEVFGIETEKIVSGLHTIPCRPKVIFEPKWLGYFINHAIYHDQLLPYITGTKVSAISKSSIKETKIVKPSPEEQTAIATALSDIDDLIISLEKIIEKKKAIKKGTMQELLMGKKRLPGFSGEWRKSKIGELGVLQKNSINPQNYPNDRFYEYSMPAYDNGKTPQYVIGDTMNSNRFIIAAPVLLFNKLNVRQRRVWYVSESKGNSVCSTEFLPFSSDKVNLYLLREILLGDKVTLDFEGMSTGTSNSQKRISPSSFMEYYILLPVSLEEQNAIARVLFDMNNEIEQLQEKSSKYRKIKLGMMSELLTGKIRLI